jgi:predicted N-acetyltransferase YhbS
MSISIRPYRDPEDYDLVDRFLIDSYEPGDQLHTWLQPRWEYMHSLEFVDDIELTSIGIAEDHDGSVLGVVHPEHTQAFGYCQVHRNDVKPLLAKWMDTHFGGRSETFGGDVVGCYVDDTDVELRQAFVELGYDRSEFGEEHARMRLDTELRVPELPEGFRLQTLAEDNDLARVNRVLWRGFNHEGSPPDELVANRARAQRTPNYRRDLNVVAVAPNGDYASYAGIWFVPENRVAYVEPVATDPTYRRMGLGTVTVLEVIRRARRLGAEVAWVGSDQRFYLEMGFEIVARSSLWYRRLVAVDTD